MEGQQFFGQRQENGRSVTTLGPLCGPHQHSHSIPGAEGRTIPWSGELSMWGFSLAKSLPLTFLLRNGVGMRWAEEGRWLSRKQILRSIVLGPT